MPVTKQPFEKCPLIMTYAIILQFFRISLSRRTLQEVVLCASRYSPLLSRIAGHRKIFHPSDTGLKLTISTAVAPFTANGTWIILACADKLESPHQTRSAHIGRLMPLFGSLRDIALSHSEKVGLPDNLMGVKMAVGYHGTYPK